MSDALHRCQALAAEQADADWTALTSPGGLHGYTASSPQFRPEVGWHCVLAFLDDDFCCWHWDVVADSAEECRAKTVRAVREWSAAGDDARKATTK